MASREEIMEKLVEIIKEQTDVDVDSITESTNLVNDLNLGSLEINAIAMEIDEVFGTNLGEEEDFSKLQTVKDLIDYIEEHAEG
jgi:acyl carrier protein